ncbi:hypothetical protein OAO87_02970 [bacterium]|nr:hypothetical protein [bacterium]
MLRFYAPDYRNLRRWLPVPRWAVDMAGESFVRSLGPIRLEAPRAPYGLEHAVEKRGLRGHAGD